MTYNAIDKSLAGSYEKYGRLGTIKRGLKAAGSGIMSGAKAVNKATGGEDLSKYFGEKIAKMTASKEAKPFVQKTVSGKDALKSAGKVGASVAALALTKKLSAPKTGGGSKDTVKRILGNHKKGGDQSMLNKFK